MNIAQVLAVYRVSPLLLVVEVEDGAHRLSDVAWKDLQETYQLFTCQATRRQGVRLARSARHHRPPARD